MQSDFESFMIADAPQTAFGRIEECLSPAMRSLNWKSHSIDTFISDAMLVVRTAKDMLDTMQQTLLQMRAVMSAWSAKPLFERSKAKPFQWDVYDEHFRASMREKFSMISAEGTSMSKTMREMNKKVKVRVYVCVCLFLSPYTGFAGAQVSQGSPEWRNYIEYVNEVVLRGIARVVVKSASYLNAQLVSPRPVLPPACPDFRLLCSGTWLGAILCARVRAGSGIHSGASTATIP